ncbi:DUF4395 domain-containing protein [Deinococcus antarcticus]|uniref:DUF4395 domain-containing protein n=1 Tax=Deinococcus antarcticus TaxID=1298767 RepID=A0ABV8A8U1_9DEIO
MITSPTSTPSNTRSTAPHTDLSALKFNAISVIFTGMFALIFTLPLLNLLLGSAMLIGARWPHLSPLRAAYRTLGPTLELHPDIVDEDPRAHHFAQGLGGSFLLASAISTLAGLPVLGAFLGLCVIVLAALNLSTRLCVGCLLYFHYRRLRHAMKRA